MYELDDDEFQLLLSSVKKSFDNREYKDFGIIKHVVGIFFEHSRLGLDARDYNDVLEESKKYIDDVCSDSTIEINESHMITMRKQDFYEGLSFFGSNIIEYQEFSKYLNKMIKTELDIRRKDDSQKLLNMVTNNTEKFYESLCFSYQSNNKYSNRAILHHIDIDDFFNTFISIPNSKMRTVIDALYTRYNVNYVNTANPFVEEYDWTSSLIHKINECKNKQVVSLRHIQLTSAYERLKEVIVNIAPSDSITN
jgi:hypothetical protein